MTPLEKAKWLVNEQYYQPLTLHLNLSNNSKEMWNYAKRCATIAVKEIMALDVWDYPHNAEYSRLYWEEVKNGIENL